MGFVDTLRRARQAIAFDGFGQNHRGLTVGFHRCGIGGIDFIRIMATTIERINIAIAHILDHLGQLWILTKKGLARIRATMRFKGLVLTINGFFHPLLKRAAVILRQ